jgi:poly(3-hydroxybutyrate) depolymerase
MRGEIGGMMLKIRSRVLLRCGVPAWPRVEARAAADQSKFQFIQAFYEEYFAVMDLPAEFYLETVKLVFQDRALPLGELEVHGRPVNPGAIKRTALLTVEGERDDICGLGQTRAAQDLCTGLRQ